MYGKARFSRKRKLRAPPLECDSVSENMRGEFSFIRSAGTERRCSLKSAFEALSAVNFCSRRRTRVKSLHPCYSPDNTCLQNYSISCQSREGCRFSRPVGASSNIELYSCARPFSTSIEFPSTRKIRLHITCAEIIIA